MKEHTHAFKQQLSRVVFSKAIHLYGFLKFVHTFPVPSTVTYPVSIYRSYSPPVIMVKMPTRCPVTRRQSLFLIALSSRTPDAEGSAARVSRAAGSSQGAALPELTWNPTWHQKATDLALGLFVSLIVL